MKIIHVPWAQAGSRDEGEIIEWGAWAEACDGGAAMTIGQAGRTISCNLSLPFPLYLIEADTLRASFPPPGG
jgi:hypothetical protein